MDLSKVPSDISHYTWEMINRLPSDFILEGGREGVESSTIRGKLDRWAITLIYRFTDDPDTVWLDAVSTAMQQKKGPVKLDELTDAIEFEFRTKKT